MDVPEAGPSGTHTPSSLLRARSSSYKGKERAVSDVAAVGEIARSTDDDVAKSLRQIFQRSMSGLSAGSGPVPELEDLKERPSGRSNRRRTRLMAGPGSVVSVPTVRRRPRRYIVSTHAGKPVFCSCVAGPRVEAGKRVDRVAGNIGSGKTRPTWQEYLKL